MKSLEVRIKYLMRIQYFAVIFKRNDIWTTIFWQLLWQISLSYSHYVFTFSLLLWLLCQSLIFFLKFGCHKGCHMNRCSNNTTLFLNHSYKVDLSYNTIILIECYCEFISIKVLNIFKLCKLWLNDIDELVPTKDSVHLFLWVWLLSSSTKTLHYHNIFNLQHVYFQD